MSFLIPSAVSFFSDMPLVLGIFCQDFSNMENDSSCDRGHDIKQEMMGFLTKHKIRKDLKIFARVNPWFCVSTETNYFSEGDAAILVEPRLYSDDKDALMFNMKHEIAHIKNNDIFFIPVVSLISSLAMSIFATCKMSIIPATPLGLIAGYVASCIYTQFCERRADSFAISNSTNDELKGGIRLFRAWQAANISRRITLGDKIRFSSSGEDLFMISYSHPSLASRICKIEYALEKNGVSTLCEDDDKLAQLVTLTKRVKIMSIKKMFKENIEARLSNFFTLLPPRRIINILTWWLVLKYVKNKIW